MNVCIIRHGETDWNAIGKLQGREDIPLNENGKQQAERCGLALSKRKWSTIVTSPLKRAKLTADIIAGILGINEVHEDSDLIERDYGDASGLEKNERSARFPDGKYTGMEDCQLLRNRIASAVKRAADRFYPEDIIIVSHGSAINSLLAEVSNGAIGTGKTRLDNACVNLLQYEDGILKILFYNRSCDDLYTNGGTSWAASGKTNSLSQYLDNPTAQPLA